MRSLKLGHQARANTDNGQEGSALARTIAVVAVIAGAVLVVLTLFGNGDGYRYKMLFQTGGQLVPGNQVMVAGQPVGTIDSIELTDDAQAEVDVKLDRPLLEGTTAQIRLTSLSGIANRYIALHMGPDPDAELPDGATLAADNTTSPVDLDQLFNTFDERTRASLQDFIQGQATVYTGNSAAARRTYKYFAPSLQAGERLLSDLNYDQQALTRFLVEGGRVFGAVAERRDDLAALTQNANEALGAVAAENTSFDQALSALPPAMRQANTTFVNLRAALDDLDPLIADLGDVAPDLPPFLRDVRPVARNAIRPLRNLRLAIRRNGSKNDLTDALRDLPTAQRKASNAVPPTLTALDDSQHIFEFIRPYSPDLIALISKLGPGAGGYDFNGHYLRAQATGSNLFDWDPGTEQLAPIGISQIFDAYPALGLGPFTPVPGRRHAGQRGLARARGPPVPRRRRAHRGMRAQRGPARPMRRIALILVTIGAAVTFLVIASGAGDDDPYEVRAIFDNAAFLALDEDVRIAGANVGSVAELDVTFPDDAAHADGSPDAGKAVAVLRIDDPAFQNFREDASCRIHPQSLLGEKFVDCEPTQPRAPGTEPPPELEVIPEGEAGEGQHLLPLEQNGKSVDLDLVNNIMREPYPDRFRLILNDLGAGLAARGDELAEIVERSNPALRETNEVLATLARQNRSLETLATDSDAILSALARERERVASFINQATTVGEATAARRAELEESFARFPGFLRELRSTMVELRAFSDQATPVFGDLREAAPSLTRASEALVPFSNAGVRAFTVVGRCGGGGRAAAPGIRSRDPADPEPGAGRRSRDPRARHGCSRRCARPAGSRA